MAALTTSASATPPFGQARRVGLVLAFVWLAASPGVAPGQPVTSSVPRVMAEYRIKAAFLLNFVKFIDWPAEESRSRSPLTVCVYGDDPFESLLDRTFAGETVNNRPLKVTRIRKWPENCDVVFIAGTERDVRNVLQQIGPGVLTVGESASFLRDGGMINFVIDDRRVRFDISRSALERASVRVSSRLLGVARTVLK